MLARKLTEKQAAVLSHWKQIYQQEGKPPTLRRMATELGYAQAAGVAVHIDALVRKGYLVRNGSAIEPTDSPLL